MKTVAIVGLGYVGLPLALQFSRSGAKVIGIDIDTSKVEALKQGRSYIKHITPESIQEQFTSGQLIATTEFVLAQGADAVIICVPTPLNKNREPDISFIVETGRALAPHLRSGVLVALESSTYPGTTDEDLRRVLEEGSGLEAGKDFYRIYKLRAGS